MKINFKKFKRFKVKDEDLKIENENLKKTLDDIEAFIKSCNEEKLSINERVILDTIVLIKNGKVKYIGEIKEDEQC